MSGPLWQGEKIPYTGTAQVSIPITPSDSVNIAYLGVDQPVRAVFLSKGGAVTIVDMHDNVVFYEYIPPGRFDHAVKRINVTGTDPTITFVGQL